MGYLLKLGDYEFRPTWHPADRSIVSSVPSGKLPRAHGGRVLHGSRQAMRLTIRGGLLGPLEPVGGAADLGAALDALRAALMATPAQLWFGTDLEFYREVEVEGLREPYDAAGWNRLVTGGEIALVTGDPYRYSATVSASAWEAPEDAGTHVVTNGGDAPAAPCYAFTVGGTGAQDVALELTNQTTGEAFTLAGSVTGGAVVSVDTLLRTVTVDGADARALFDGQFALLDAGANTLELGLDDGTIDLLTVTWRERKA